MVVILMGVSGCGKTTVGMKLSEETGFPFYDADDFHPQTNVEKMESGRPLNDDDRKPWLEILSKNIKKWNKKSGAVLACSALKKKYRQMLNPEGHDDVKFVYLEGNKSVILERMEQRKSHYMPPALLDSQFEALEEPGDAITVSIDQTPEEIVKTVIAKLSRTQ